MAQKTTDLPLRDRETIEPTDVDMTVDLSDTTMDASGSNVQMELHEKVAAGAIGVLGLTEASESGLMKWGT